jgi:hypothetical protein
MTQDKLSEDIVRAAREAVTHDPEVNISSEGVRTIFETALLALRSATPMPGFDATELDMIRHGDMLGPELGQRVADALAATPMPEPVAWQGVSPDGTVVLTRNKTTAEQWEATDWIVRALVPLTTPPAREISEAHGPETEATIRRDGFFILVDWWRHGAHLEARVYEPQGIKLSDALADLLALALEQRPAAALEAARSPS